MKKCYCCGADVPDQSKFCPKCGKSTEITQDLIDRAKANDPEAQTELYERTYKTVYSRIRAKVPDNDTAMDIMQESYLSAFTNLDQLQTSATFPSWLLTIASRQVCTWYRKNGKENENIQMSRLEYENNDTISDEDDLLGQPEYREDFSPDESLDRAETGRLLSEILDTLPEDQRIILIMRYYDEMSLQEISDELGVNLSTVKTRLTAGKKKVEAKVLELEKSGTKLYSLGPVAFLVFLLHHAELFAPAISANTVIGLTAAGAAGAGGAAAAHVTASAAAKTAVAAVAKGISVKVVAIVAAAVVVAGGGITAAVVLSQPAGTSGVEPSNPSESVESETPSETPEPSETAEPIVVDPPSTDTVMEMAEDLNKWVTNSEFGNDRIDLDLNTACELSAIMASECGYADDEGINRIGNGDYEGYMSAISEGTLDQCLHDLFGSEYQASDFHNTERADLIQSAYPDYSTGLSGYLVRDEDGEIHWYYTGLSDGDTFAEAEPGEVIDVSPVDSDDGTCTATVRYDWYTYIDYDYSGQPEEYVREGSAEVVLSLKYDEDSKYDWAIKSIQEGPFEESDEYRDYTERPSQDTVHAIVDPLGYWSLNAMYGDAVAVGPITPTLNQAAELAAAACYMNHMTDPSLGELEIDNDSPITWGYIIPESELKESLRNRFGPEYNLSDFTNTVRGSIFASAFETVCNANNNLYMMLFTINGHYDYSVLATGGVPSPSETVINSVIKSDTGDGYIIDIEYKYSYTSAGVGPDYEFENEDGVHMWASEVHEAGRVVEYKLVPNAGSDYGWVISQVTYKEENDYGSYWNYGEM